MRNANCSEKFLFEEMEIGGKHKVENGEFCLVSVNEEKVGKGIKTFVMSFRIDGGIDTEYNLSITVGEWTPILSYWELDEAQSEYARKEFDYLFEDVNLEKDDVDGSFFQNYAGELCDMGMYMREPESSVWYELGFDGVHSTSYFTNNAIKISESGMSIRFGYCYTF
jgi:hypothetical protein